MMPRQHYPNILGPITSYDGLAPCWLNIFSLAKTLRPFSSQFSTSLKWDKKLAEILSRTPSSSAVFTPLRCES